MFRTRVILAFLASSFAIVRAEYLVGLGKADITGPVVDVNMMGYANPEQIAGGLHTRLYARALIVASSQDSSNRVVFVNLDACMASQAVTFTVIEKLKAKYGEAMYSERNVVLSGTHTHSGPAGYLQYLVYDITGLGFVKETFDALVDGILLSISRAHGSIRPGSLSIHTGVLLDANINRSPTAYQENPKEEREQYEYNIDKEMTLLRINDDEGHGIGAFSWFAVHGTSMNNTNRLINGDNKGAASLMMEESMGKGFISAFCQANVGDTSPNTLGAYCIDTGLPCDAVHSTCDGRVQKCIGRGPGWPDDFRSTNIIASKQKEKAEELFGRSGTRVSGSIQSGHIFLDMRNITVKESLFTRAGKTCKPAMGFSFAAGTTDGPGAFDFTQSDTNGTLFWRLVRDFITTPTKQQEDCHKPKPILLDVGEMHYPYEWVPYIVEISIMKIGSLVVLAVPGEFTTMSGRRLIRAVRDKVEESWGKDIHFVIAGLSNTYSSYITTFEEYQVQRYEGGFTLFGPHTLDAYIQEFRSLADCMIHGKKCSKGPAPPDMLADQWSLVPGVVVDATPFGKKFGDVSEDLQQKQYAVGDIVAIEFHAACPRNNFKMEQTYVQIERKMPNQNAWFIHTLQRLWSYIKGPLFSSKESWTIEYTDTDWETKFIWYRKESLSAYSYARIEWHIPEDVIKGTYRIRYLGDHKNLFGSISPFEGLSHEFEVL